MKRISSFLVPLGLIVSACNLPAVGVTDPGLATAAAMTVQAAINTTPLASPGGNPGSAGVTPTFTQAMASVGEVTNCRTGPGTNYERVTQILPAEPVQIVGFYSPNYWIVSTKAGECWVSAEFTTPVGSYATVPSVTPPSTPQGSAPAAPTFPQQGWTYFCRGNGSTDVTLSWNDKATNETGYRVLRNGVVIAELPVNTTYFAETIALLSGQSVSYQIQAYNPLGETSSSIASMTCP